MPSSLNRSRSRMSGSILFLLLTVGACGGDIVGPPVPPPPPPAGDFRIEPANPVLRAGQTLQLAVAADRSVAPGSTIWSVGDPLVAKISPDGLLTALVDGQVVIRADRGGNTAYTLATITDSPGCPVVTIGVKHC